MSQGRGAVLIGLLLVALSGCVAPTLAPRHPDGPVSPGKQVPGTETHAAGPLSEPLPPPQTEPDAPAPGRCGVTTVLSPATKTREISLAECVALALENGRTGNLFDASASNRLAGTSGIFGGLPSRSTTDNVRVFSYDPASFGTQIERALSRFDVIWQNSIIWDKYDRPSIVNADNLLGTPGFNNSNVQNVFSSLGLFANFNQADVAEMRSSLLKPLATGGVAGITFRTDWYSVPNNFNISLPFTQGVLVSNPLVYSPAYRPAIDFTFEQPLLRGGGVLVNQVREAHPGALRTPFAPVGAGTGILLARVTFEQAKLEFERQVHALLFGVEQAYWELYASYWELYSREMGMREAHAAWQTAKARYDKGGVSLRELAELEDQYQALRLQRLEAMGRGTSGRPGVLEAERRLRYVVGLPPEDGARLVPSDVPTDVPYLPDWEAALADARAKRPELLQVQQEIKGAELALVAARDLRRPDLRFISKYNLNGQGHTLGGGLDSLASNHFNDWELGLLAQVVLGQREGNAAVTKAKLQIAQRFALLRDQEDRIVGSLQRSYRDLVQFVEEMRLRRQRREAAAVQLQEHTREYQAAREPIEVLLQAQRKWADALRDEHITVCNYNIALADFERQKGTIPEYQNVILAEGPLPAHAQERASEHIRERTRAILLRQRPLPVTGSAVPAAAEPAAKVAPAELPEVPRQPLPHLLDQTRDLPAELPAAAPAPRVVEDRPAAGSESSPPSFEDTAAALRKEGWAGEPAAPEAVENGVKMLTPR